MGTYLCGVVLLCVIYIAIYVNVHIYVYEYTYALTVLSVREGSCGVDRAYVFYCFRITYVFNIKSIHI